MPEISDAELNVLNRSKALLDKLWNDPKEGMTFKKKVKSLVPDANIPELDIVDSATAPIMSALERLEAKNKELEDRWNDDQKSRKNTQEENELRTQLESIRKQFGFTDEGMEKVISRMKDKNNPDAEAAAAFVASQNRKSQPITDSALLPSTLNLYGSNKEDADFAELNKDPQGWADKKVIEMLNDFAQQDAA